MADASAAAPTATVDGNRLTLLTEGPARLDALLALIDGAQATLRVLYYIYADDAAGRRVNAALVTAAGRGVRVALVVDGFGSDDADSAFFAPLRAAGIAVCRFHARWGRRYLLRNHQKLALADAEGEARILIGGFNVEDDYFAPLGPDAWRDLGLLIEGPAAARIGDYFDALEEWIRHPRGKVRHLNRALSRFSEGEGALRWLIGGPTRRLSPWARTLRADLRGAGRVDIVAGYFTPSPTLLRRLDRVGRVHHPVRIMTAGRSDNQATIAAARFTYRGLLTKGVRIFEYARAKLHTKLYVIDEAVHVGSANFDMRSLYLNLELMLRIEDAGFAALARDYVDRELADADEITLAGYRAATGWWRRTVQFGAYLLVAVIDPGLTRGLNRGAG